MHVQLVLLDAGLVELSWQPPVHRNGIIISYVILYSEDKEKPDLYWQVKTENGRLKYVRVED